MGTSEATGEKLKTPRAQLEAIYPAEARGYLQRQRHHPPVALRNLRLHCTHAVSNMDFRSNKAGRTWSAAYTSARHLLNDALCTVLSIFIVDALVGEERE